MNYPPDFKGLRMSFGLNSVGASQFGNDPSSSANASIQTGPDLEEIQTEVG